MYGRYAPAILILVYLQLHRSYIIIQFFTCTIPVSPCNFYVLSIYIMTYNTRFVFQMKKLYITAPVPLMTKLFPAFTLVQLRSLTGLMHGVNCEKKIEIKWLFGPKKQR